MSDPLRVAPLARYRAPKYPGPDDPDPLTVPERVPFPFSGALVRAVAATGLLAPWSAAFAADGGGESTGTESPHPLTLARSGLPYRSPSYGTGLPQRLDANVVRQVVGELFAEAGFELEAERDLERDGVRLTLDGWDEEHRVGWVFLDHQRLGDGALLSWATPSYDPNRFDLDQVSPALHEEVERALALSDPEARQREMDQLLRLDPLLKGKVPWSLNRRLAIADRMDPEGAPGAALRQAVQRPEQDAAKLAAIREGLEAVDDIADWALASWRELERIDELARDGDYIAIISQYDRRFAYHGHLSEQQRDELKAIRDPDLRQEREIAMRKEIAKEALANLETAVRGYLRWARGQGIN